MPNDREHLATLAALLAIEAQPGARPHLIARDALELLRIGRATATQAVRQCNGEGRDGPWNDADEARHEKRRATWRAKAEAIAVQYGAKVELGGDPRGYVLRLIFPEKKGHKNGWGDGWGVA